MRSALCFGCNVKIRPMKKSLLLNAVPADSTTRVHVTEVIGICSSSIRMNRKANRPRGDAKKGMQVFNCNQGRKGCGGA